MTGLRRFIAVLCLFAVCAVASAQSAAHMKLARELASLTGGTVGVAPFLFARIAGGAEPGSQQAQDIEKWERNFAAADEEEAAKVYASSFTQRELEQLVAFMRSEIGTKFIAARTQIALKAEARVADLVAAELGKALERSKEKRTMADIRSVATASEAFAIDNNRYPEAGDIAAVATQIEPTYIRTAPRKDGWGTALLYVVSADRSAYRFVSAGPDRKFDPSSRRMGVPLARSDDIVFENGEFLQQPSFD